MLISIKLYLPLWLILFEDGIMNPEGKTISGHEKLNF